MRFVNLLVVLFIVEIFLYAGIAILAWWRRKSHPRAARFLAVYALVSLFLTAGQVWLPQDLLVEARSYRVILLAVTFLFLSRAFLYSRGSGWGWGLLGVSILAGLGLLGGDLPALPKTLSLTGLGSVQRQAFGSGLLTLGWGIFTFGAAGLTLQAYRQAQPPYYRNPISYWLFVLGIFILGQAITFAGYEPAGDGLRLLGALLAAYVILTPRLPDIHRAGRRAAIAILVTGLALALYGLGFAGIARLVNSPPGYNPFWAGLLFALLLVLFLNPLLRGVQKLVNQWIPGREQDQAIILRQYSQEITNILDLKLLAGSIVGTARSALGVQHGFLFLVDNEKALDDQNLFRLRGVEGLGDETPEPGSLVEGSPLAAYFRYEHCPLKQAEIDFQPRFRDLPKEEENWLASLGCDVYIPIYRKDEWIGLLALGPKGSGAAFWEEDLDLLCTLADQTAVALENVRLVEGLMRLNNEFRRAFTAMDQVNRRLERLERTKSDFISIASHELRTPLTVVSGSSQILIDEPSIQENPYYRELLSKIRSGVLRLNEIVDSMLDMAKIDARELQLDPQPVVVNALIESVCREMEKTTNERGQTIEIINLTALPSVEADLEALRKVFHHLITNAVKYTPDGGKIMISGSQLPADLKELPKGGVEVVVRDSGIGIDPQFQELIFVKFYQTGELALHSSGKARFKGSGPGLGLAIVRGIVEAHGGKVWVESPGYDEEACPGSQFHVVLPLVQRRTQPLFKI